MSQMVDLVIFGGTGDLSTRKLLPALFQLHRHKLADRLHRIIATGRGATDTAAFRQVAHDNLLRFLPANSWDEEVWSTFCDRLHYCRVDASQDQDYLGLAELLDEGEAPGRPRRLAPVKGCEEWTKGGRRTMRRRFTCGMEATTSPHPT